MIIKDCPILTVPGYTSKKVQDNVIFSLDFVYCCHAHLNVEF